MAGVGPALLVAASSLEAAWGGPRAEETSEAAPVAPAVRASRGTQELLLAMQERRLKPAVVLTLPYTMLRSLMASTANVTAAPTTRSCPKRRMGSRRQPCMYRELA